MSDQPEEPLKILSEPLLTEDGLLNPVGMAELEVAIMGRQKTYERLAGDSEWSDRKDRWTFKSDIVGAFAMCACRQSSYGVPEGLENVCKYLNAALGSVTAWETAGNTEASLCDINRWLYEILYKQGVAQF